MKKIVLVTFSIVLFGLMTSSIGQEAFKFGVVDLKRVLDNYYKYTEAGNVVKAGQQRLSEDLAVIEEEIKTLQEKLEKTKLFVEKAQTANLETEIQTKQQEYQRVLSRGNQALFDKEQELLAPIFTELREHISDVGKAENYDLIIDKQAALYFNEKYDLTDKLIELINKDAKKAEPKKEDAGKAQPPTEGAK